MHIISLFLYDTAIQFYHLSIWVAAFFSSKAKKWIVGRKNWEQKLGAKINFSERPIWIHCASLGEFEQGRPLIEAIKKEQPTAKILLTFYSPSGYEIRKNYPHADIVCYLPADGKKNAQNFLKITNPKIAIFVKYEFWFHYLNTLKNEEIPTFLISAIFRESQPFFKWYGGLHRRMLGCFERIFVQDEGSLKLLESIPPAPKRKRSESMTTTPLLNRSPLGTGEQPSLTIAGDTRIDRVLAIQSEQKPLPIIEEFCKNHSNILICGSTWGTDETILISLLNNSLSNNYKTIIAPHEIHASHIADIQKKLTISNTTYSNALKNGVGDAQVLLIDNIGLLAHLYRFGKIAYIGGGFGSGIHNTLEPIVFGLPVIFGKRYQKFQEAVILVETGGGFSIKNEEELLTIFKQLQQEEFYKNASKKALRYVQENKGATGRILKRILKA